MGEVVCGCVGVGVGVVGVWMCGCGRIGGCGWAVGVWSFGCCPEPHAVFSLVPVSAVALDATSIGTQHTQRQQWWPSMACQTLPHNP